jgi:hypothetical protein
MYNKEQLWYNIKELTSLFGVSKTIINKRINKNQSLLIEDKTFRTIKSKQGKQTNQYHYSILGLEIHPDILKSN